MDLSNSVIMPREDFAEMQAVAWNPAPMSVGERVGSTVQTALVLTMTAGAVAAASWGWATAMDWLEEKRFQRTSAERTFPRPRR